MSNEKKRVSKKEKKKIELQWLILELISKNGQMKKQDLIKELKVSEKTVARYIDDLTMAKFPIYEDKEGKEKIYKIRGNIELPIRELNLQEHITVLLLSQIISYSLKSTPFSSSLESAINKIHMAIPIDQYRYTKKLFSIFSFYFEPITEHEEVYEKMDVIQKSCIDRNSLYIEYKGASRGKVTKRNINPWAVYYRQQAFRVVAYCQNSKARKEFLIRRIQSLKVLDEKFNDPNFDLYEYIASGFGAIKGGYVEATVRVYPPVSRWVREQNLNGLVSKKEQGKDIVDLYFATTGREGLMRQILEWGGCAEVLSPPDFIEEITLEISKAYHIYKGKENES